MKVGANEVAHWLREAEQERLPAVPLKPAPAQQQHPQHADTRMEDADYGSSDTD